ncbi:hypothetical protein, partial [Pseudomonas qingdaonensis]
EDELMGETRDALADKVTRTGKALYADATQAVHNADASAPAAAAQAPREGPADRSDGLGFRP